MKISMPSRIIMPQPEIIFEKRNLYKNCIQDASINVTKTKPATQTQNSSQNVSLTNTTG